MTVQAKDDGVSRKRQRRVKLDKETAHIAIIGSGLAGLSAAIALTQAGFQNVTVWERDPSLDFQKEGYGLTLTYNPKGPLAALGVLESVAQADCPSRSHYLFRASDGLPLGYFGNAFFQQHSDTSLPRRGQGQRGNLRVPRKVLRKILYDKLVKEKARLKQQQQQNHYKGDSSVIHWNHKLVEFQWDESTQRYNLTFEAQESSHTNKVSVTADLLVAADGIRSPILQQMYITCNTKSPLTIRSSPPPPTIHDSPEYYGLRPLGVRLILGIADFDSNSNFADKDHSLQILNERGFYTLDGKGRRLFTMPYQSNRFATHMEDTKNRIMWQLSFATAADDSQLSHLDPESLKAYVSKICHSWHEPVMDLIDATPLESFWGTDLMDRDTQLVYEDLVLGHREQGQPQYPRLVVVGDALHSMSPFKGQGANQALADGPLLAHWLQRASVDPAIAGWWRETLNRTVPIVNASRKAAKELHTCAVNHDDFSVNGDITASSLHGFAGVNPECIPQLLEKLQQARIGAHLGRQLDEKIYRLVEENGWFHACAKNKRGMKNGSNTLQGQWEEQALQYAMQGNTQALRLMSLDQNQCQSIFSARDDENRTCLHLAVLNQHVFASKWLLVELKCCVKEKDAHGNTANDYSAKNAQLSHIFCVVANEKTA
jgi:salicylate hydroxylase